MLGLGGGQSRCVACCRVQVYVEVGSVPVDLDDAEDLKAFFAVMQGLNADNKLLAYHDRSDGGLFATLTEMAFAGHVGMDVKMDLLAESEDELAAALFAEELGGVIQVRRDDLEEVLAQFEAAGLVLRHNFEGGHAVFEMAGDDHHDHMVCTQTGEVIEFIDEVIEERQKKIAEERGYEIVDHSLILYVKPIKS